ncbi:MAG: hypothetical protein LQ337_002151 [Flavoplaca oasis]|nr:MAG: hypothetical protein LQ337_002151 [Flavoplaca oasis]
MMSLLQIIIACLLAFSTTALPQERADSERSASNSAATTPKLVRIFTAKINLGEFQAPIPIQGGQRLVAQVNSGSIKGKGLSGTIKGGISVIDIINNGQTIVNAVRSFGSTTEGSPFLIEENGIGSQADNFARLVLSIGGSQANLANQFLFTEAALSADRSQSLLLYSELRIIHLTLTRSLIATFRGSSKPPTLLSAVLTAFGIVEPSGRPGAVGSMAGSLASSPPASPPIARPLSAVFQSARTPSRLSINGKAAGGSRASDDDSKTLVKVAVRVRPPLQPSDPGFDLVPQRFQRSMVHVASPTGISVDSPQGRKLFFFDQVFGEDAQQETVWDYLHDSVDAFIQGFNVSVLAYGQSGSGKSYTMGTSGPAEQSVVPRAAAALFNQLAGPPPPLRRHGSSGLRTPTRYSTTSTPTLASLARANANENWQLKATYVEIYNEQLRDLLVPDSVPPSERSTVVIREDKGRILLTGLHQITINSVEDLLNALNFGSSIRQTDATAINAKSSRSHAVFSLNLVQRKNKAQQLSPQEKRYSMPVDALTASDNWVTIDSKLHFVDLAGSERLKNTQASGERAKEGISINGGLASLGKVISQLSSRQAGSHVSYRDSKLTRLLQDSLGGNAITYMIACVTPAEFHLGETLNTVHYAQRARAIQTRPQIQQVSDESDKQAIIDRLRAEVSFLREQIRGTERGDRRAYHTQDGGDRQSEVEIELQNQLLDVQESYTALSQRHAKLISEITMARDTANRETPTLTQVIGDSAVERLKRSNSFAEAVEQVVLEYEKTIQSLESSLAKTRSSLAATESNLMERETKCAYAETVNQQLQSRLQKLTDREASTEHYLHDLEAKLDGHSSGEEKSSAVIIELRKEIARIRENEASCEDYIATLEERLAESDQDMELMQREVDRLEHVVERQRSLGKLDNLLYEFDHLAENIKPQNGHGSSQVMTDGESRAARNGRKLSETTLHEAAKTAIPESDSESFWDEVDSETGANGQKNVKTHSKKKIKPKFREVKFSDSRSAAHADSPAHSPAQPQFVADKLENVTRELLDLRVEHESTVSEYDLMSAKYEEALRTLAELQDAVDEARHPAARKNLGSPSSTRPSSFLEPARVNELKEGQPSSSRSLLSELSSAGASTSTVDSANTEEPLTPIISNGSCTHIRDEPAFTSDFERLKRLEKAKDETLNELKDRYNQLQEQHGETLDMVEELKAEVQKARMNSPTTPTEPVIRRKSSQNVMTIDRAHRSFASLRNIAAENLEDKPDTMQSFELNLNTAMHELHQRSERVQVLEAELTSVKKDMEGKIAMISGLTRERSSLKASSPMDISVVASMHDQLLQHENQIKTMQEEHAGRERELMNEIDFVRKAFEDNLQASRSDMPGVFPETPAVTETNGKQLGHDGEEIVRLRGEIEEWQQKHEAAINSMEVSERKLLATTSELEASMASVESMQQRRMREIDSGAERDVARTMETDEERAQHAQTVQALRTEIAEHKSTIKDHVAKIVELERAHASARVHVEESKRYRAMTDQQLSLHQDQIAELERKVQEHQSDVEFHKHGLKSLHDSHARELESLRSKLVAEAREDMTRRNEDLIKEHQYAFSKEADALNVRIETLTEQLDEQIEKYEQLVMEKDDIASSLDQSQTQLDKVTQDKETATRLVNELEDQLTQSYDQQRATSHRISILNSNRDQALQEALAARTKLEEDLDNYRRRLEQVEVGNLLSHLKCASTNREQGQMRSTSPHADGGPPPYERSNSLTSNLRKSTSVTSLPSPPPAIPLPPLPAQATANGAPAPVNAHEYVSVQYAEDQEARIKTIEKHLFAEKQLTATLEEALVDLEHQGNKTKGDLEAWKKKCWSYEDELTMLKKERNSIRHSVQAVEEERSARKEAEAARAHLEERMSALQKKKKKSGFNCF